jgi:hypothetical protein
MKPEFEVGDCVQIAAAFRDASDAVTVYEVKKVDGSRYTIGPLRAWALVLPSQVVTSEMIEKLTPGHVVRCLRHTIDEHGRKTIP